jgi:hypothetical protein
MNCDKIERLIYLYEELLPEERRAADSHLSHCNACMARFQQMQQMRLTLQAAASVKAKIKSPGRLTQHVMLAVHANNRRRPAVSIPHLLDSLFTRYAFGALSLVLLFFFVSEQQKDLHQDPVPFQAVKPADAADVVLNTSSFLKASQQENNTRKRTSLYACMKSPDCDEALIRNFKRKKTTSHENI